MLHFVLGQKKCFALKVYISYVLMYNKLPPKSSGLTQLLLTHSGCGSAASSGSGSLIRRPSSQGLTGKSLLSR